MQQPMLRSYLLSVLEWSGKFRAFAAAGIVDASAGVRLERQWMGHGLIQDTDNRKIDLYKFCSCE